MQQPLATNFMPRWMAGVPTSTSTSPSIPTAYLRPKPGTTKGDKVYEWEKLKKQLDENENENLHYIILAASRKCNISGYYNAERQTDITNWPHDEEYINSRIRLPNVIVIADDVDYYDNDNDKGNDLDIGGDGNKNEVSVATFIQDLSLNKLILFNHSAIFISKTSGVIVDALNVQIGDEWKCSGRLMGYNASGLEESGLFHLRFDMRGVVTGNAALVQEKLLSHMSSLTHHVPPNEPMELDMLNKYIDDNRDPKIGQHGGFSGFQFGALRSNYEALTKDEKAPYIRWFRDKKRLWVEEERNMNAVWLDRAKSVSANIHPVYVKILAKDVTIHAEAAHVGCLDRRMRVVAHGITLIDNKHGGPQISEAKFLLDSDISSTSTNSGFGDTTSTPWTFDDIHLAAQNGQTRINMGRHLAIPNDLSEKFLLTRIKAHTNISNRFNISQMNISLKIQVNSLQVDLCFGFFILDTLILNDWCHLSDIRCELRHDISSNDYEVRSLASSSLDVDAGLLFSLDNDITLKQHISIPLAYCPLDRIPLNISIDGHPTLVSAFDFLLSKRIAINDPPREGLSRNTYISCWEANIYKQLSLSHILNHYLSNLEINGSYNLHFHLGAPGIMSVIAIDPAMPYHHPPENPSLLSNHPVSFRYGDRIQSGAPKLCLRSISETVSLTVRELLDILNIDSRDRIPSIICQEMILHKFCVLLTPDDSPLLVVSAENKEKGFFYLHKRIKNESKVEEILVKIHSRLINSSHFPILEDNSRTRGLMTGTPSHFYIYSTTVISSAEIEDINSNHILTTWGKNWQEIDIKRIHEIPIGATFYTTGKGNDYITTHIDHLIHYEEEEQKKKDNTNKGDTERHDDGDDDVVANESSISVKRIIASYSLGNTLLNSVSTPLFYYMWNFLDLNSLWYGLMPTNSSWYNNVALNDEHWYRKQLSNRFDIDLDDPLYSAENLSRLKQYEAGRENRHLTDLETFISLDEPSIEDESKKDHIIPNGYDSLLWRSAVASLQHRLNLFEFKTMKQSFPYTKNNNAPVTAKKSSSSDAGSPAGCFKPHYSIPTDIRQLLLLTPPFTAAPKLFTGFRDRDDIGDAYMFYSRGFQKYRHADLCWFSSREDEQNIRCFALYTGTVYMYENAANQHLGVSADDNQGKPVRQFFHQSGDELPIIEYNLRNSKLYMADDNTKEFFRKKHVSLYVSKILPIIRERKGIYQWSRDIYDKVRFTEQEMERIKQEEAANKKTTENNTQDYKNINKNKDKNKYKSNKTNTSSNTDVLSIAADVTAKVYCKPLMTALLKELAEVIYDGDDEIF